MTEFIDELVRGLNDEQRRKNDENRLALVHADLIASRAPNFAKELREAAEKISTELRQKLGSTLGGVTFTPRGDYGWSVKNGGHLSVSVDCEVDVPGQTIQVTTSRRGPMVITGDEASDVYRFTIEGNEYLRVVGSRAQYSEPSDMAEEIFEKAFVADLVRP